MQDFAPGIQNDKHNLWVSVRVLRNSCTGG